MRRNTISLLDREQMYPGNRLQSSWAHLGDRERKLLAIISERLLVGQRTYGELSAGKRPWKKEAMEEMVDGIVYTACELLEMMENEDAKK